MFPCRTISESVGIESTETDDHEKLGKAVGISILSVAEPDLQAHPAICRHLLFPISDDVRTSSINDASDWSLLLAHEGIEVSVRYQFSGGYSGVYWRLSIGSSPY